MKISDLIKSSKTITAEEANAYIRNKDSSDYQIIDVRQPGEYEQGHLPGAILIPLDELMSDNTLIENKPTILYCRSGHRSGIAARWLEQNNFTEVYDLGSSITTMSKEKIGGSFETNLDMISIDAEYGDAFELSWQLEESLKQFYIDLSENPALLSYKDFFVKMAHFEDLHQVMIDKAQHGPDFPPKYIKEFLDKSTAKVLSKVTSKIDVLATAMTYEAQSFDLYIRLANKSQDGNTKELFFKIADEEKHHLKMLSKEMDKLISSN